MPQVVSGLGLVVMLLLAWVMSPNKKHIPWRVLAGGLGLQFAFALFVLKTELGRRLFVGLEQVFSAVLACSDAGAALVFGGLLGEAPIAFKVLPAIIFFSSLMTLLYHIGLMQLVVGACSRVMRLTLGTSGAETLSSAANIFVGQTEAPLVIRPYIAKMTLSELNTVMVGGFATIAGSVFVAYVEMLRGYEGIGVGAKDLLAASVISAPAALVVAKVMRPEVDEAETAGEAGVATSTTYANALEAVASGATDGVKLAINVGAMLIAFFALISAANGALSWSGETLFAFGWLPGKTAPTWSLEAVFGFLFAPLAWLMGIEWKDCGRAGELLGLKWFATEFVAYQRLGEWAEPGGVELAPRTVRLLAYALCGFANFASIGIQIGGLGAMAPNRLSDLARLAMPAMIGGSLAAFMTACVAGVLL